MRFWKRRRRRRLLLGGQVFLVTVLLILLAAWNTNNNLYYLLFGGLATFLVLSAAMSGYSVRKLTVDREAPSAVHRMEPFAITVQIVNKRRVLPAVSVRVEKADESGEQLGYVVTIPARRAALIHATDSFPKRGVYPLPDLVLATAFPFGLIEHRRTVCDPREVVVYPRIVAVRTAVIEQARGAADITKTAQGLGDEFFSLREYIPGDDLRRIAWRATARLGTVLVKELEHQTSRRIMFLFDTHWAVDVEDFAERFEDAIELIASLAVTLLNRQYAVSVVTPSLSVPEGEGQGQAIKILEMLARLAPTDGHTDLYSRLSIYPEDPHVTILCVSPDPAQWGQIQADGSNRVLDPREVIHA